MKRKDWWLVLVLLLAAGLRFFRLDARSLWFDEALCVLIGRLTLQQVLTGAAGSSHPPAYYLLLHVWQVMGMGRHDWPLRSLSVLVSLFSVALIYRAGGSLFSRRAGLLTAVGTVLTPFQVYYAQEARMYALATALTLGTVWCFARGARRPRSVVAWVLLGFHLWLLLCARRFRSVWLPFLTADLFIGLAFVPQVVQFLNQTSDYLAGEMAWQARPYPLLSLTDDQVTQAVGAIRGFFSGL